MLTLSIFLLGGAEFFGRPFIEYISLGFDHFFNKSQVHFHSATTSIQITGGIFFLIGLGMSLLMLFQAFKWFKIYQHSNKNKH